MISVCLRYPDFAVRSLGILFVLAALALPADAQTLRVMPTGLGEGRISGTPIDCGALPAGATEVCTRGFTAGTVITLTAAPKNTSSTFTGWGGDCPDTLPATPANQCQLTLAAGQTYSVRANFDPATPINRLTANEIADVANNGSRSGIGDFLGLAANARIDTPAEFIAALPEEYKQNWILMPRSESLQTGTAESPRILMPSANALHVFTIGMTEHSSYPGSHPNAIEFMQYDPNLKNFRFHEIVLATIDPMGDDIDPVTPGVQARFPRRPRGVSIDDKKCFACHTTRNVLNRGTTPGTDGIVPRSIPAKSKPNWDTYDSWGGMLPFNRDRIYRGTVEAAAFRKIFNLWTWQTRPQVRSIIEQLALQPPNVPDGNIPAQSGVPDHRIRRDVFNGGANDGHIVFGFDPPGTAVTTEPRPTGSGPTISYEFNRRAGSSGTQVKRDQAFLTLHHSAQPRSDEGRGVELFDQLTQGPNPQRIGDELNNHPIATGNLPIDVRPIALAIAQGCYRVTGGTAVSDTQTISPALPADVAAFLDARNGMSFDQLYDDTRRRAQSLTRRKADIQATTLERTNDIYAYDPNLATAPPPPAIIDGLIQEYGSGTAGVTSSGGGSDTSPQRLRQEIFRRPMNPSQGMHRDETVMSSGLTRPEGAYVDREDDSTDPFPPTGTADDNTAPVALYRYFLEPLGVSVDKWSMGVRGRSRTYTFADLFLSYTGGLTIELRASLGATADPCALARTELGRLTPAAAAAVPTYTDIQRIFNKSCIECHGGLGYPPYHTYGTSLDLSEDESPAAGERRLWRSMRQARTLIGAPACPPGTTTCPVGTGVNVANSDLYQRITDDGNLAHPYNPFEPYNTANPDDPTDPDIADERCPSGLMPCEGPPLSKTDIETFRRWIIGGRPNTEGDPHIRTVDGVHYDFQSVGEFVLLRDVDLELQVRQTAAPTFGLLPPDGHTGLSTCASVNTAVALRVGPHRVTYQPTLEAKLDGEFEESSDRGFSAGELILRIDGKPVDVSAGPIPLAAGGRVLGTSAPGGVQVQYPGGTTVVVTPGHWSSMNLSFLNIDVRHARAVEGVMGAIAPGEWLPALADGSFLGPRPADLDQRYRDLYGRFADSWRVTAATSLFDYEAGLQAGDFDVPAWPRESAQGCVVPPQPGGPATNAPQAPLPAAEATRLCAGLVDPQRQDHCEVDVTATGEAAFAETYLLTEKIALLPMAAMPQLGEPTNHAVLPAGEVDFTWLPAEAPGGGSLTYRHCVWSGDQLYDFNHCTVIDGSRLPGIWGSPRMRIFYACLALLAILLLLLVLLVTGWRHKLALLGLLVVALLALLLWVLGSSAGDAGSHRIEGMESNRTYFWKVVAEDEHGTIVESETRRLEVH